jgi:MoaA/NifB/PqqE/SkfB family radical SAM enzyme
MAKIFFIQWDSTNDCNLDCLHCYHNREGDEHSAHVQRKDTLMTFEEVKSMIDDLVYTSRRWGMIPRLQISGGEPMMRGDLMKILDYTKKLSMETRLLTNGTLITLKKAEELYKRGIKRLQISIDGSKQTHNNIRKKDYAYDRAMEGISNCSGVGILVTVSMTFMQSNKREIEDVVVNSIKAGAGIIGFKSYVPDSKLGLKDPEFVGAKETYDIFKKIIELRKKYAEEIKVLEPEVLWQLMHGDTKLKQEARRTKKFLGGCAAGFLGLSVLSDGTIYPCRRLPIPIGNIKEIKLVDLMANNEVLKNLRNFDKMKEKGCCEDVNYCRGCRAVAYAITGDYMAKDPMCFKQYIKKCLV